MTSLVACLIAKNEARYLAEWVEYHAMIGVDHFYIYDNDSEDDMRGALRDYSPHVTLISWPGRLHQQLRAYQHFFRHFSHRADWVAIIDADEFIRYRGSNGLRSFLQAQPDDVGGLEMPWVTFGTNGHKKRPAGLVIQNYTQAHAVAPQRNCKTLCRPLAVAASEINSPHRLPYQPGFRAMPCDLDKLALHHYTLRSYEDVVEKVRRGDAWSRQTEANRWADMNGAIASLMNKYDGGTVFEGALLDCAEEVRERMDKRRGAGLSS